MRILMMGSTAEDGQRLRDEVGPCSCLCVDTVEDAHGPIAAGEIDVAVIGHATVGVPAPSPGILARFRSEFPSLPVVALVDTPLGAEWEEAIRQGADEYWARSAASTGALTHALRAAVLRARARDEALTQSPTEALAGVPVGLNAGARFKAFFLHAPFGAGVVDSTGRHVLTNEAYQRMLGYTAEELRKLSVAQITHPDDLARDMALYFEVLSGTREHYQVEKRYLHKSGAEVWANFALFLERDAQGNPLFGFGIAEDITRRKRAERVLRAGEARQRLLLEQLPAVLWSTDRELFFTSGAGAGLRMLEPKSDPSVQQSLYDYFGTTDPEFVPIAAHRRAIAGESVRYEFEWHGRRFASYVEPFRDADGVVVGALGLALDVTEQRRAESALRESESRFRMVAESLDKGLLITDPDEVVLYANSRVQDITGYAPAELVGKRAGEVLLPSEYRDGMEQRIAQRMQGESERYEIENLRKDGSRVWVEIGGAPFRNTSGEIVGTLGVISDISERKRAEEALRKSNETLRALIESSPLAIVALDPGGKVTLWNPAAERIFGWTREEVLGGPLPYVPADGWNQHLDLRRQGLQGEAVTDVEVLRCRKDGSPVHLSVSVAPLRDAQGCIYGLMSVNKDISEQKRLEEQLRQAQKMEAVGRLAGGIAHDFNNLLMAIQGNVEFLLQDFDQDAVVREDLREVESAARRAKQLTQQLLAFSRQQALEPKVLDLNAIVSDMEKILRRLIGSDVEVHAHLDSALGEVRTDAGQLEQVVLNLAVNARDAMPGGGRLTIETRNVELDEKLAREFAYPLRPGPCVLLSVSDTGQGMDRDTQARIFEPFFTTKEVGKGTGLGLATVYGIVKQSGGYIGVDSEVGKGTTFRVYLPRVEQAAPTPAHCANRRPTAGSETVLLVEDEPMIRKLTRRMLQQNGYAVLEAGTGKEAIEACRTHAGPIHLLLTDMVMPRLSGRELAGHVAALRPGIKILFMSGYTNDEAIQLGVLEPGTAFLQKPVDMDTLARGVRTLLDDAPAPAVVECRPA